MGTYKKLFILLFILISVTSFAVTPPTNKSVNGIIEWVDENFTASETFITSGTTQIYTAKSVGFGTDTPDVTKALHVVGDSKFDDTIYVKEGSYNNLSLKSSVQPTTGYYASIYHIGGAVQGVKIFDFQSTGAGFSVPVVLSPNTSLSWLYSNVSISGHNSDYTLRFNTGGTETARFTDNQNFLVGQTVDDGVNKLQVTGNVKVDGILNLLKSTDYTGTDYSICLDDGHDTRIYAGVDGKIYLRQNGTSVMGMASNGTTSYVDFICNGEFKGKAGSTSYPSFTFNLDTNTGIANTSADNMTLSTGGLVALEIDDSQNVEIPHYLKQANSMAQICMTENTTAQAIPTGTSWTTLTFTGGHDHYQVGQVRAFVATNSIQILATGVYSLDVNGSIYCDERNSNWKFNALVDGSPSHCGFFQYLEQSTADKQCVGARAIMEITTAPAVITIGVQHNDGNTTDLEAYRMALIVEYKGEIQ